MGPLRFTPDSHGIRARAHLIERSSSYGRWRMHDLVRLYATQLEDERADQDGREEAMERPLEYCFAITRAAIAYLDPAVADPAAQGFPEREQALRWLDVELPNLTAGAGINQHPSKATDLALALAHMEQAAADWLTAMLKR